MATIVDVAARAGVGVGTVSRVINDSPLVSDRTRAKVLAVIEELDYRPSSLARGLSLGHSTMIGVVVPFFDTPSVVERLRGVADVLNDTDYDLVLFNVDSVEQRDERFGVLNRRDRSEGALVISLPPPPDQLRRLRERKTPVVFVDVDVPGFPCVTVDDVEGGRLAARHLLELGHRRIAFVGDPEKGAFGFTSSARRRRGFVEAMKAAGQDLPEGFVRRAPHGLESARALTAELLGRPDPPTAVFAASDTQALGVLEAARTLGLEVPGGLSVVGFDDIEGAAYGGLTTVRQPLHQSGAEGARLLLRLLGGEGDARKVELPLEVVARGSTAPPGTS